MKSGFQYEIHTIGILGKVGCTFQTSLRKFKGFICSSFHLLGFQHCVRIRSYSAPHFPAFGLYTETYGVWHKFFYIRKNNKKVDSVETGRVVIEDSSKVFHKSNCAINPLLHKIAARFVKCVWPFYDIAK